MNRREALRHLGQAAGAWAIWRSLPAATWAALPAAAGWSESEENMLTVVGDTILPATPESPGAGAVQVGRFITMMLAECHPPVVTGQVKAFLKELALQAGPSVSGRFDRLDAAQREALLRTLEQRAISLSPEEPWAHGFKWAKNLALLGYFTSEPGATQALRYDPVPGAYRGKAPIDAITRAWAT